MLNHYLLIVLLLLLEISLWLPPQRLLRLRAAAQLLLLAVATGGIIYISRSAVTILFVLTVIYQGINLFRIIRPRRQADYVYSLARRTSLWLTGLQLLILAAAYWLEQSSFTTSLIPYVATLSVFSSFTLLGLLLRSARTTRPPETPRAYRDHELPTLSVLIPARNETEELNECLRALIKSDYPKLEIIVLDDCSQNTRTPEIIKGFAHDGVRFIAGREPGAGWLAKNHAYARLAESASGDLLLFCGVDARFKPETLRLAVASMLDKKKTMMSLMPANTIPAATEFESLLVQPSRYAWELVPPRRWFDRPPVLSTCWLIQKELFDAAGGFKGCSRSISPERHLARYAATHGDGYTFMQSDTATGVLSEKQFSEQQATAIRVRYPQLHQRIELTLLSSLIEFLVLVLPFALLLGALLTGYGVVALISALSVGLLTILYALVMQITYRRFLLRSLWLLPFAALYDIAILNTSMWKYEFSEVIWKGRNVCIPVMRVIAHLPPLPEPNLK